MMISRILGCIGRSAKLRFTVFSGCPCTIPPKKRCFFSRYVTYFPNEKNLSISEVTSGNFRHILWFAPARHHLWDKGIREPTALTKVKGGTMVDPVRSSFLFLEDPQKTPCYPLVNLHSNGKPPFSIGDTSSNGGFPIAMLVYRSVCFEMLFNITICIIFSLTPNQKNTHRKLNPEFGSWWPSLLPKPQWTASIFQAIFWRLDEADLFDKEIWMFPKIVGVFPPKSSILNRIFHYFHYPFWGFPRILGNTHRLFHTHKNHPIWGHSTGGIPTVEVVVVSPLEPLLFIAFSKRNKKMSTALSNTAFFNMIFSFQGQFWEVLKWKNFENVHRVKPSN